MKLYSLLDISSRVIMSYESKKKVVGLGQCITNTALIENYIRAPAIPTSNQMIIITKG
tara:strand:- start:89 stop:262 length:174 start_codon:yes stop_codon:yes gene_type:complete